jgi:CRP/FNR family transcriptional regulator
MGGRLRTGRPDRGEAAVAAYAAPAGPDSWHRVTDCRQCSARQQALFGALGEADLDQSRLGVTNAVLPPGTLHLPERQAADALYSVRRGLVKLLERSPAAPPAHIVRLLGRGAALGLEGLEEGVYWHSAIALQETDLCRIPLEVVRRLQAGNPLLVDRLFRQWEAYLAFADRWITELSTGPVRSRVRCLLALLVEVSDRPAGQIELPFSDDLAAIPGASVESVSRTLAELKRGKVLVRVAPRTYT